MKAKFVYESLEDILRPKSEEEILNTLRSKFSVNRFFRIEDPNTHFVLKTNLTNSDGGFYLAVLNKTTAFKISMERWFLSIYVFKPVYVGWHLFWEDDLNKDTFNKLEEEGFLNLYDLKKEIEDIIISNTFQ